MTSKLIVDSLNSNTEKISVVGTDLLDLSNSTNGIILPNGPTSSEGTPENNAIRFDTTDNKLKVYPSVGGWREVIDNTSPFSSLKASIVRENLEVYLDASNPLSYPGSGNTWSDLTENGNDGTLVSGVLYSPENGGCFLFDGVDDGIQLVHNSSWVISNNENFSLCTMFYKEPGGSVMLFSHQRCNSPSIQTTVSETGLGQRVNQTASYTDESGGLVGRWNYVVGTFNGEDRSIKLYLNGLLVGTAQNTAPWSSYNPGYSEVWLGRRAWCGGTNEFLGKIALFKFYKGKELSESEVLKNFNAVRGRFGI